MSLQQEDIISTIEKVGTQVGNTCVGAFRLLLGDSAGATQVATSLIALGTFGAALPGQCSKRACKNAQARAIEALSSAPEFTSVNPDRLLELLTSKTSSFSRSDLIEASKSANNFDLDAELAKRVHQALPFDGDDDATKRLLYLALEAGMRACNTDEAFKKEASSVQLLHLVQAAARIDDKIGKVDLKLDRLIKQSADKARELHLTEQLFISLARRIDNDVADIDQAHRELERAVEVASEEQAKSALPANTDEAVTAILATVDELNNAGQIDEAATYLAEEEARIDAGRIRFYEKAIAQAIITRDVDMACNYEVKKISLDASEPAAQFDALWRLQNVWFERGRDKGLNFDLEIAIALSHKNYNRASDADERGAAQDALGTALAILGNRDSDTQRLEDAVVVYRAALEERTQDRVPLDWAMTQNNLGSALRSLGDRDSDTQRLEEALAAFRAALEEHTQDRVPLDWAMTQCNLGNALQSLGDRDSDTQRLEEAVLAYRAALKERTQDRAPLGWAMTQCNLGNALQRLGDRDSDTQRLEEAVLAYRAALEEYTQDRVPLDWATTQNNLGGALQILGDRDNDTQRLEEAVLAYRAALKERTQDRVPLDWAKTQNNLGNALQRLGDRDSDTQRLEEAVLAYRAALEEYTQDRVPLDWAKTQNNLGGALAILGNRDSDTQRLEEAVLAYRAALEERTQDRVPLDWAMAQENLALINLAFSDHPATTDHRSYLNDALVHVDASLEVYDVDSTPFDHGTATRLRQQILDRLANED